VPKGAPFRPPMPIAPAQLCGKGACSHLPCQCTHAIGAHRWPRSPASAAPLVAPIAKLGPAFKLRPSSHVHRTKHTGGRALQPVQRLCRAHRGAGLSLQPPTLLPCAPHQTRRWPRTPASAAPPSRPSLSWTSRSDGWRLSVRRCRRPPSYPACL